MAIVGGLDVHRAQVTFDWVDEDGQGGRGRIQPVTREVFRSWLEQLPAGGGRFAVEATTGWRFIVEELQAAGFEALLAEPAETSNLRGSKRRAKTDRLDAAHLRQLLAEGRVPESWIAPPHILDLRETVRLRKLLRIIRPRGSNASRRPCITTGSSSRPGSWPPSRPVGSW